MRLGGLPGAADRRSQRPLPAFASGAEVTGWEIVIGIETHAQLATKSKMFSGASSAFGAPPNTQASAVDIALPGTLPVANAKAVEHAIRFGLAVKGQISRRSIFARKNYFYPDLPKGYQISQYELPIVAGGEVKFFVDGEERRVRLTRAHLEEDAGKLLHELFQDMTGVDLNRAGTPLLEIVSAPELREEQIKKIASEMPELPDATRERFARQYALPAYDAGVLTASRAAAGYFEALVKAAGVDAKLCANWQTGALNAALNEADLPVGESKLSPASLAGLLKRIADGTLSGKMAKEVFDAMWAGEGAADAIIEKRGLRQISDSALIEKLVDDVLASNAKQVQDYRAGKEKAFNSLVGQVMKATKGKADPELVNRVLRRKLSG